MKGLFAIFKTIIIFIWLVDIMNINFLIGDMNIAHFLDITLPLNGWFWFLFWFLIPSIPDDKIKVTLKKSLTDKEDKES